MPETQTRPVTAFDLAVRAILALVVEWQQASAEQREDERRRREWMFDAPEPVWRAWLDDNL